MSGYALHPAALGDVDSIWVHIAKDSPDAADRVIGEIFDRIRSLVFFPEQGYKRPALTSRPLRFTVVRQYVIAYAPDRTPLRVIAVIHGRRSPRVFAAALRTRK